MKNMHAVLLEKSERNSSLRTLECTWEDITKMDLKRCVHKSNPFLIGNSDGRF